MSSPLPENPYAILGVSKDAQLPEIRSAHRKLVLKCHPDKVQDPTLKAEKQNEFQRVQQAYEILSNESEREKYDHQVRAAELRSELRKQAAAQSKANSSAPRSSRNAPPEFEVYTSPRASHRSSPTTGGTTTFTKVYWSTRAHSDEERRNSTRGHDAEPRSEPRGAPTRRESSFADRESRPSKRESEREREREKDRDRDRDRDRRKKAEAKSAKEEKERRDLKKARDKQMSQEKKRQSEEKRRYMTPDEDLPPPRMEKKSSNSRKYDPRDPSLEREPGYDDFADAKSRLHEEFAENYINAARVSAGAAPRRSKSYHSRTPYVPSPPPAHGVASAYPSPDEDEPRRSSASARRRGSGDMPKLPREKSYTKSSRERLDEEHITMETRPASFQKSMSSAAAAAGFSSSPPRPLPRTNTMPAEATFSRPIPGVTRANTFTEGGTPRGRMRSKMDAQVEVHSEEEDAYEQERERERRARDREAARDSRDARDRKHRSSKKHRSPERYREEPRATTYTYALNEDGGAPTAKLTRSSTRRIDPDSSELYDLYGSGVRHVERERPPLGVRESSYSSAYGTPPMNKFPKVRTTKIDNVQFSKYETAYT